MQVIYAARHSTQLTPLILRKFRQEGDVSSALRYIEASSGIQEAKALAAHHATAAADMVCLHLLPGACVGT
jgi:geranylgeranyl pyrophosphate synthase